MFLGLGLSLLLRTYSLYVYITVFAAGRPAASRIPPIVPNRRPVMKLTQYYPVICTADVAGTAAFYQRHFRFAPAFASDWYVHLTSTADPGVNLAILDYRHETIPE